MASFNELFGQLAGGLGAAGSAAQRAFMGNSLQSAFSQQLAAAQRISDERAHQMNVAMTQMVQVQMERQRYNELLGRDLYEEFTNRYVATPEAAKKCPPPRDPAKCPPPKPIPREYMDSIADWMPKPGDIVKMLDESTRIKGMTNRDRLRAEVAAWTRRAA